MGSFAHDRRSPQAASVADFPVRPTRRAFDLVALRSRRDGAAYPTSEVEDQQALTAYEASALDTLAAIGRAAAPSVEEIRRIAARNSIIGPAADLLSNPRVIALLAERFAVRAPDVAACRAYYQANLDRFRSPTLFQGREILIGGDIGDRAWRAEAYGRAERIIAMLVYNRRVFDDLVIYSSAASRARGGCVGPIARDSWDSEAATAFFSLKTGEVFPLPVPSSKGFHILLMDGIEPGRPRSFVEARREVDAALTERAQRAAAARHCAALLAGAA
jgi:peptidyl-prolyl cis-trans isomerase C